MTDREVMQQVLEALEGLFGLPNQWESGGVAVWRLGGSDASRQAMHALRTALEQPEQEPVALVDIHAFYENCANFSLLQKLLKGKHYLYTTPPSSQPEHGDIRALKYRIHELEGEVIGYKRVLEEAALKKLADLGQEIEQEPVSRYCCHSCFKVSGGVMLDRMILCSECGNKRCPKATDHNFSCTGSNDLGQRGSIYGTPPAAQRPWVGLTDEEVENLRKSFATRPAIAAIEAKLKERNNG